MHVDTCSVPRLSSCGTDHPTPPPGESWEAALFARVDRIVAVEDVPDEYAWRLAWLQLTKEVADERARTT